MTMELSSIVEIGPAVSDKKVVCVSVQVDVGELINSTEICSTAFTE